MIIILRLEMDPKSLEKSNSNKCRRLFISFRHCHQLTSGTFLCVGLNTTLLVGGGSGLHFSFLCFLKKNVL